MTILSNDFPALDGRGVTQAHADFCAQRGHAKHTVDGTDSGVCPRCGDVLHDANGRARAQAAEAHPVVFINRVNENVTAGAFLARAARRAG